MQVHFVTISEIGKVLVEEAVISDFDLFILTPVFLHRSCRTWWELPSSSWLQLASKPSWPRWPSSCGFWQSTFTSTPSGPSPPTSPCMTFSSTTSSRPPRSLAACFWWWHLGLVECPWMRKRKSGRQWGFRKEDCTAPLTSPTTGTQRPSLYSSFPHQGA